MAFENVIEILFQHNFMAFGNVKISPNINDTISGALKLK